MKISIIGAGGVGGYFGAKLAKAGFNVSFLARGEHLDAIRKDGLTVKSILGDFRAANLKATDRIEEIGTSDLIILCVKAWQVKEIRNDLYSIIHEGTTILPLQNGVLAVEELEETIDRKHLIGGLCRIISKIESPGIINHFGVTPTIIFGELDNSQSQRVASIKGIFDESGINSSISDDIDADLWRKFIGICLSGLLAISGTTYGELREVNETRQLMIELLTEIYDLSQKIGIDIEPGFIDKTVSFIDTFPYNSTASLTRDVWEGKPSEIEYQNGTVVKLGEKAGIETPVNRFVYNCIMPMEIKARRS